MDGPQRDKELGKEKPKQPASISENFSQKKVPKKYKI